MYINILILEKKQRKKRQLKGNPDISAFACSFPNIKLITILLKPSNFIQLERTGLTKNIQMDLFISSTTVTYSLLQSSLPNSTNTTTFYPLPENPFFNLASTSTSTLFTTRISHPSLLTFPPAAHKNPTFFLTGKLSTPHAH